MQRERDLWDVLADDHPDGRPGTSTPFSEWLGGRDLEQLAAVARVARFTGDSFGRRLRADRRGE